MPVESEEFESSGERRLSVAPDTHAGRVLSFLKENGDRAYTLSELHDATEINKGSLGAVLSRLRDDGLVVHRGKYWTVAEDERLAAAAAAEASESGRLTEDEFDKDEWLDHAAGSGHATEAEDEGS